jgi:hypothetical protein
MKIPFDIKYRPQIESGEYKVETRDGKKVRVLCYDANSTAPVVALVTFNDGSEGSRDYYSNGTINYCGRENPLDLFVVTPEEELTVWEKVVKDRLWRTLEYSETFRKDENKWVRELAAELLAIARKQLIEERYTSNPRKTDLYNLGKAEALKDLPRWNDSRWIYEDGWLQDGYIYYKNHSIPLKDLEKLPGFKED